MIAFIDEHRDAYGVEPICRVLPIAPSTYHAHAARRADPDQAAGPSQAGCGAHGRDPARVRGELPRLRRAQGLAAARPRGDRGRPLHGRAADAGDGLGRGGARASKVRTTFRDQAAPCPLDRVNRQFKAPRPNRLWVADFTYVATWAGFVYVAFVIDVFARRIVGWRVSRSARADFVLDALEQALHERRPFAGQRPRLSLGSRIAIREHSLH